MSAPSKRGRRPVAIPSYRLHKASGQAVVTVRGRTHYLGPFGSEASRQKYGQLLSGVAGIAGPDPYARGDDPHDPGLSIAELCLAFRDFAESHYVKDGHQTDEVDCYRSLIHVVSELFGLTPVSQFGPNQLRTVRDGMVSRNWSRGYINRQINRLRHMVKWGVGRDLVAPGVLEKLRAVEPLLAGKSAARETRPRRSVPLADIQKVQNVIRSKQAKALIELQLCTAARPGELLSLTTGMIQRSETPWIAQLRRHKTEHFGKSRILAFGPKAQRILIPLLRPDDPDRTLFSIQRWLHGNFFEAFGSNGQPAYDFEALWRPSAGPSDTQLAHELSNSAESILESLVKKSPQTTNELKQSAVGHRASSRVSGNVGKAL